MRVYLAKMLSLDYWGRICCYGDFVVMKSDRKPFALAGPHYDCEGTADLTLIKKSAIALDGVPMLIPFVEQNEKDCTFVVFVARHDGFRRDHVFYQSSAIFTEKACMNMRIEPSGEIVDIIIVRATGPAMFFIDRMDGTEELYTVDGAGCKYEEVDKDSVRRVAALENPAEWGEFGANMAFYGHARGKWVEALWGRECPRKDKGAWQPVSFRELKP